MTTTIGAADLGIDLGHDTERALFKWLLASWLMGKRIQGDIAANTYRVLVEKHGVDTPAKLAAQSHRALVRMLGEGHYTRYDESSADRLRSLARALNEQYQGKVSAMGDAGEGRKTFEKRLLAFEGVGPKTVEIFMRDAARVLFP